MSLEKGQIYRLDSPRARLQQVINRDRTALIRAESQRLNSYCLFATLMEIAAAQHPIINMVRPSELIEIVTSHFPSSTEGTVEPDQFVTYLEALSGVLQLRITNILVTEEVKNVYLKPGQMKSQALERVKVVKSPRQLIATTFPCMNVLTHYHYDHKRSVASMDGAHAETQSKTTELTRIRPMLKQGWQRGMVVEFQPYYLSR